MVLRARTLVGKFLELKSVGLKSEVLNRHFSIIKIQDKMKEIGGRPYCPIEVARVNDQVVRIALVRGEYHWHKHAKEDELFYVIRGRMTIQMKAPYSDIILREGQIAVIPKGVEHCPTSQEDTYVLMFEPSALQSKGD